MTTYYFYGYEDIEDERQPHAPDDVGFIVRDGRHVMVPSKGIRVGDLMIQSNYFDELREDRVSTLEPVTKIVIVQ